MTFVVSLFGCGTFEPCESPGTTTGVSQGYSQQIVAGFRRTTGFSCDLRVQVGLDGVVSQADDGGYDLVLPTNASTGDLDVALCHALWLHTEADLDLETFTKACAEGPQDLFQPIVDVCHGRPTDAKALAFSAGSSVLARTMPPPDCPPG